MRQRFFSCGHEDGGSNRVVGFVVGLCISVLAWAGVCFAAEPVPLSIVFTGNTLGWYEACPTCGGRGGIGGLGRRATVFADVRAQQGEAVLFLGGAYEFMHFRKDAKGGQDLANALVTAYGMLDYDALTIAPAEARWLADAGVDMREDWTTLGDAPRTAVIERAGVRVGVVMFPAPADIVAGPDAARKEQAVRAARELRPSVDILVGMSPWGEKAEAAFLREYDGAVDLLFGTGPGMGDGFRMSPGGGTLWLRSVFDGRGVMRVDVLRRPTAGEGNFALVEDFRVTSIALDGTVKYDIRVANLFSWL
ncbi:hypothetical protein GGQ74_001510 [Desulfobaculum xiamenense]|uniref:Uncharacterized protein n=1 Tax=Desulfobaculum xiamenense TaxID=995050 RepID=A0A846QLE6_9BACT|nr:hypothetical protein [Desulfobaculum xiamenense]NJB67870.1 hypothetical protein [Desulfobaculum xiamenense]